MPSFRFSKDALIWESTAVSNAFFCEYMPYAPESYVKVYLYAAMLSRTENEEGSGLLQDVALALEMTEAEVETALRYWERCRLVERIKDDPPVYRIASVAKIVLENSMLPKDESFSLFAQSLYRLFEGKNRKLHGAEIQTAYEWVEELHLSPEVVTMLVQHMLDVHGVHFAMKSAQKLAVEMASEKIQSVEDAESFFERKEKRYTGAKKILSKLGMKHREPSDPEIEAYDKWTGQWGFSKEAITFACDETLAAQNPSFAYLDKILESKYKLGHTDLRTLQDSFEEEKLENDRVREVLRELGITQDVVGDGDRLVYRELARHGHALAMVAAREVKLHSRTPRLDRVQELITAWEGKNIVTAEQAEAYVQELAALDAKLNTLKEHFHHGFIVKNESTRASYRRWSQEWGFSDPLILLAADYAADAEHPLAFMDKILSGWKEQGITTLEAAKADHEAYARAAAQKAASGQGSKKVNAQMYEQRTDDLLDDERLTAQELEDIKRYGL